MNYKKNAVALRRVTAFFFIRFPRKSQYFVKINKNKIIVYKNTNGCIKNKLFSHFFVKNIQYDNIVKNLPDFCNVNVKQ